MFVEARCEASGGGLVAGEARRSDALAAFAANRRGKAYRSVRESSAPPPGRRRHMTSQGQLRRIEHAGD